MQHFYPRNGHSESQPLGMLVGSPLVPCVPTVLGLFRDCFRQGTGNSVVKTPSSPYQEERDDRVMSPGPAERSRCLGAEAGPQNRPREAVSSPAPGLLFLKGQWHFPAETANRNQNLGLIKSVCSSLQGSRPEHKLKKALRKFASRLAQERPVGPTYLLLP